ncbi:chloride channel protein [Sphingomonas glacialis]|uniref:Chloride channel protein n=1 Tax=Sphingomonas glacialis TaxID=658225 RepID=A0A502FF32_9SPHN|nr:chloride channel protein [Sphingomonas glacialis]TPG48025.1 chloride channel protein [Sphingomonas glacialis]
MKKSNTLLFFANQRRRLRSSEAALIGVAVLIGLCAGLMTLALAASAHLMQNLLYGVGIDRLSALSSISPVRLLALPIGGVLLAALGYVVSARTRAPVDVVEANALHGGIIPFRDSLVVSAQTLLSNGAGASVGLEAAYAQMGGGLASVMGQWLRLRRNDLRILVGAGAGAAVGAAFGAPLTGAFYAFEIVIGAYTPAAIAPVAAACLTAAITIRASGMPAYLIALPSAHAITTIDYFVYAALGLVCAAFGIVLMRAVTTIELWVRQSPIPDRVRPAIGGLLLIPIAWISPQALSAGHGALHLDLTTQVTLAFLTTIFLLKMAASAISLGFGFRGGLFFASLFLGSLAGQIYAALIVLVPGAPAIDPTDAALVGMAGMAVAVVGGPMTMSLLVLEATHDFALTGTAITAALCASTLVRERFGFSFSTWRLHTRGETIRSARDIGWVKALTAGRMMRREPSTAEAWISISEFRRRFQLGAASRVVLVDREGVYAGLVLTPTAYAVADDLDRAIDTLAILTGHTLRPEQDVAQVMRMFEDLQADDLAVLDESGKVLGTVSEKFVRRRYSSEIEKALKDLYGEG